ncbi:MAG: hypothetical protein COA57_02335 [Flavobacteriales bacterium]|nr:MAG: hypothetical protein COA57_02335 [Flavobacteriales bacterium]
MVFTSKAQPGTDCANPFVITGGIPFVQTGQTTCGFGDDYNSTDACGSSYMNGDDFLYAYTPTVTGGISVDLTNTSSWTGVFVYDGCPSAMGTNCISSATSSSGNPTIGSVNLTAGLTYYIMISTWPSPQCTGFDIAINPPPPPNSQDCDGAIAVCQNVYSETTSFSGTGNIPNEINSSISCLGSGEKNDVWYVFTVQTAGNLCFTITPNVTADDYDWAVFDLTNANCSDIFNNVALEVSCNYSGTSGATGANGNAGAQNEPCMTVNVGETYVLNVSQFTTSTNGYTLDFSSSTATIFDNISPNLSTLAPVQCNATSLSFDFSENILCSTIEDADFELNGPGGPYTVSNVIGPTCAIGGNMENNFTINISPALSGTGTYSFCLTSNSGLVTDLCGNVASPNCISFTLSSVSVSIASYNDISCFGANDGTATATVTGGTTPITYSWSPSGGTTTTATGLSPGTYTITAVDANSCSASASVTIAEPTQLIATTNSSTAVCTCPCAGVGHVFPSGGTPNYTVSWSNGYSDQFQNSLCPGIYTVTITDANGCTATGSITIP